MRIRLLHYLFLFFEALQHGIVDGGEGIFIFIPVTVQETVGIIHHVEIIVHYFLRLGIAGLQMRERTGSTSFSKNSLMRTSSSAASPFSMACLKVKFLNFNPSSKGSFSRVCSLSSTSSTRLMCSFKSFEWHGFFQQKSCECQWRRTMGIHCQIRHCR